MARRAVLGSGNLNPFGGGQVDFGAFQIGASPAQTQQDAQAAADRAASLQLNSQEILWNAGQISNEQYLAALQAYAATQDQTTIGGQNAIARVATYEYRFQRDAIQAQVDAGQVGMESLLAYDQAMLSGINQDSEEYQQRLGYYRSDQVNLFNQREQAIVDQYNKGQMTTAQLNDAYIQLANDGLFNDNRQIRTSVEGRLADLADRVQTELDNQTISDYQKGKISPAQFLAYGAQARTRYEPGTSQYQDWTSRLSDATDQAKETQLLYRYGLTQDMIQLEKFIQSSKAPTGGTSTSKRTVLGADGAWHVVDVTKATAPSASELKAYADRQAQVAAAKQQLTALQAKIATVGGIVSTDSAILYYKNQLTKFAVGSDEWYQVQGKLDSLNDTKAQEALLKSQGIRISYPKAGSAAAPAPAAAAAGSKAKGSVKAAVSTSATSGGTADVGLESFMTAIAHVESGGRYTAQNRSSGAYGKYQIMPANWAGWAKQYLGNANAAQTPENQEKVAAGKMADLYKWLGDWRAVAAWWVAGGGKAAANPSTWSPATTRYVDNVMAGLGKGPTSTSTLAAHAAATNQSPVPVGGTSKPTTKPTSKPKAAPASSGPLRIVTGIDQKTGEPKLQQAGLPSGLDGAAFAKFYAQYDAAFKSGATEFSVNTGSGTVHYWVGDDTAERINLMRQVDALQINKARVEMEAYAGTDSAATKANAFDNAIENAAAHELRILDTTEGTPAKNARSNTLSVANTAPNTLAQGIALLDTYKSAISNYVALGDKAYKNGDLTKAYSYYQLATNSAERANANLSSYAAKAQATVRAIEDAYGVQASEALAQSGYETLAGDIARLSSFGPEIDTELNKAVPNLTELLQVVRKDASGQPVKDTEGPGGQLSLDPHYHFEISSGGQVKVVATAITGLDYKTGKATTQIPGKVNVDYLIGDKTVNAFVDYQVTDSGKTGSSVGWLVTASGQRVPLDGKFYTRQTADGKDETWYEDPFTGKWSKTPVVYKAPAGFQAVTDARGQLVLQFGGSPDPLPQGQVRSDYTYSMVFDPATGTYTASRSKPGSFMTPEVKDEQLGSVRPGTEIADTFTSMGFSRDLSGLSGDDRLMSSLDAPFVGGTAQQYSQWKNSGIMTALKPVSEFAQIQAEKALIRTVQTQQARTQSTPLAVPGAAAANQQQGYYSPAGLASTKPAATPALTPLTPIVNAQTGFTTGTAPASTGISKPVAQPGNVAANKAAANYSPSGLASTKKPVALAPLPVTKPLNAAKPAGTKLAATPQKKILETV